MIAYLEGQILAVEPGYIVLKTQGVGYQVLLSKKDLETVYTGQTIELSIQSHIREDAFELYGFISKIHRQVFLLITSVSGIGPKLGLSMLSILSPNEIVEAIITKDINKLALTPGVGKKTAERLALELRDKADKIDLPILMGTNDTSIRSNLEQAIKGLGYSKSQSDRAISALNHDELQSLPLEILIKKTINLLAGNFDHDHR